MVGLEAILRGGRALHPHLPPLAPHAGDLSSVKGMVGLETLNIRECKLITGTLAGGPLGGVDGGS